MSAAEDGVADALDTVIRAVPGVTALYPSASLPAVVVGTLLAEHTAVASPRLVSVSASHGEWRVTAVIGVDDEIPAQLTGRAVHDRIVAYLASGEAGPALPSRVTVRISVVD